MDIVNNELKNLRRTKKLKQKDIARKLSIGVSTYNRKENGISDFTESEMLEIGNILDVHPSKIFFTKVVTKNDN